MSDSLQIKPVARPIKAAVRPPGSKSITNRALVCAALARGASTLEGALRSEDTRVMIDGLTHLGIKIDEQQDGRKIVVTGCDGRIPAAAAEIFVAGSGTTIRFLTAMVALGEGTFRLQGNPRMHERPIADLLDALGQLGADARSERSNGCPPVMVSSHGLKGGSARVRGDVSSQFLSGLLMVAPYARQAVSLVIDGELVSAPYVMMTARVMESFGVTVERSERLTHFKIPNRAGYTGRRYPIEPDASAASYFFAAAAITGGEVRVEGLSQNSIQGDVAFCDCLARMGCRVDYGEGSITVSGGSLSGIEVNMADISDTVQTLAAVALVADGPTRIEGVGHIRHKETDRIGHLAAELRKLGATVDEHADGLTITPAELHGAQIETYNDHRMAMSLALVGLVVPGVVILDPACTEKTYPGFFDDLAAMTK